MRKALDYIILSPLVYMALQPPWSVDIECGVNSYWWLFGCLLSGFLAIWQCFLNTNPWLKVLTLFMYAGCFLSSAPYMSFTMFWSVIACSYYFHACKYVQDRKIFYRAVQVIFCMVCILLCMQLFGKDTLFNFNNKTPCVFGTIGNRMVFGSYVISIAPFLLGMSMLNIIPIAITAFISQSSGAVLSVAVGIAVYTFIKFKTFRIPIILACVISAISFAWVTGDIYQFDKAGRLPVWKRTVELTNKVPVFGYGIGMYKILFPIMSQDLPSCVATVGKWEYENTTGKGLAWRRTHNCWLQILFETGYVGFLLFLGFVLSIAWKVRRDAVAISGLAMVGTNMLVHFPTRMAQSVLVLIAFLAFCQTKEISCNT